MLVLLKVVSIFLLLAMVLSAVAMPIPPVLAESPSPEVNEVQTDLDTEMAMPSDLAASADGASRNLIETTTPSEPGETEAGIETGNVTPSDLEDNMGADVENTTEAAMPSGTDGSVDENSGNSTDAASDRKSVV